MSKDLFLMMREQEVASEFPTKKEIKKSSTELVKTIIDNGNHNLQELYAQTLRLKEALATIESELKKQLPDENFEAFGLKATFRNGGNSLNYEEDEIYKKLKADLDARVELLKLAQKQDVLDTYGNEVPKVGVTPRKSSLSVSF